MRNKIKLLFILSIPFLLPIINARALTFCPYSKEYEAWLELTPTEQQQVIMPEICAKNKVQATTSQIVADNIMPYNFNRVTEIIDPTFDLRNDGGVNKVSGVRNQGTNPNCWAYATMAAVESNLLVKGYGENDLSERHMDYATRKFFNNDEINEDGYDRNYNEGGNFGYSSSYLIRGGGLISEAAMPYASYYGLIDLSEIQNQQSLFDVNEIIFFGDYGGVCSPETVLTIKSQLVSSGALFANIYMTQDSTYYNDATGGLYYNGTQMLPNHSVAIIGWDDNFTGFNLEPEQNGAWLVKNSYGSDFGLGGYFYVSYSDQYICDYVGGIISADDEVEDNNYYFDPLGNNRDGILEGQNYVYGANIFTKKTTSEELTEVTFAVPMALDYEVYINPYERENSEDSDETYLNSLNPESVASDSVNHEGYYTVKIDPPIELNESEFTVMIKFIYPDSIDALVPLSTTDSSIFEYNVYPGNSYASDNKTEWQDVYLINEAEPYLKSSISIKAATNSTGYLFSLEETPYFEHNYMVSNIQEETSYLNFIESLAAADYSTLEIFDQQGNSINSGSIGTGMTMKVTSGGVTKNYTLVVKGDTTGDGNVGSNDALQIRRHVVGLTSLGEAYRLAGDVDGSASLSSLDALKIRRYVVGLGNLWEE